MFSWEGGVFALTALSRLGRRKGQQVNNLSPAELELGARVASGAASGASVPRAGASVSAVVGIVAGPGGSVAAAASCQVGYFRIMFSVQYSKREKQRSTHGLGKLPRMGGNPTRHKPQRGQAPLGGMGGCARWLGKDIRKFSFLTKILLAHT